MEKLTLAALLMLSRLAAACPVCDTATGAQVRAGLFDGRVGLNLFATLLPFVFFAAIGALLHHGLPSSRRQRPGGAP